MKRERIPQLDEVDQVYIAITCESLIDEAHIAEADEEGRGAAELRAWQSLRAYFAPLAAVRPEWAYDADVDHIHQSEFTDARCFVWQVGGWLTPDEWARISAGYLIDDVGHGQALPDDFVPTLGIITDEGHIPAVAIEGTHEGWGVGGYEPQLIPSFYVALAMKR